MDIDYTKCIYCEYREDFKKYSKPVSQVPPVSTPSPKEDKNKQ